MELLTEYIIRAVVLFVVVLVSEKRDELLMMTDKQKKTSLKKKKKRNAGHGKASISYKSKDLEKRRIAFIVNVLFVLLI